MTLLTIVQDAANELSIPEPELVIGNTDSQVALLRRLANKEGKELAVRCNWTRLTKEATFTTVATSEQTTLASVASDFARYVNESMWNRTTSWPIGGPLDSLEWQQRQASGVSAGVGNWFRIRAGSIYFYPTPTAGDTIYFEYVTNLWCNNNGTHRVSWTVDSDTSLLDEELMTLGVIWRFLKAKGLDYGEEFIAYEKRLEHFMSVDGGKPVLDMTGIMSDYLSLTIPESGWDLS
jgi:hypothetical protein